MHKPTALLIGIFFATMAIGADAPPPAREILDQVRLQQSQQQLDLQGQLRSDATVIPFRITQTGPVIRYTFTNPAEVVQLRLGEDGTRLDLVLQNSTKKFSSSRLDERIGGTAVTYGDLALKFLYWPDAQVIGTDTLRTRNCWKLRLAGPSKDAPYATVLLWVDKESGANEIRMVRPGFYLGRAYANRAFLLNFTLYNPEVADAGTEAFAKGEPIAEDCWPGEQTAPRTVQQAAAQ